MNFKELITELYNKVKLSEDQGKLPTYIPELAKVESDNFGVFITTVNQYNFGIGNYHEKFSIQSIAKVLSLTLAFQKVGNSIWKRLGVEPSGATFNSLIQLELENGIPRNPFINAGAIVIADILISHLKNPKEDFLDFVRALSNNYNINYSPTIADSEKKVGFRNIALCNFMKSFGNINNEPSRVLDFYFDICSIEMNCKELSETFIYLANNGLRKHDNNIILSKSQTKRVNAIMQTCGMYDESGEFSFKVGLPGKSGVSGGIIAIHPNQYAIAVWSPKLNAKGNSYRGMQFLEELTTKSESSIF